MPLIERYVFRQLLNPTIMAVLALAGVALLSRSITGLDILTDRQSPMVFVQITLLAMPMLVSMILPMSVLVAALMALNRLHSEQELVICFAGGVNRWRLVSPAMSLAGLVTLFALFINLWGQPVCYRAMRELLTSLRADLASSVVRPGEFVHPAEGLTVYAQSVDENGTIHNLFVYQKVGNAGATTINALEGRVSRRSGSPVLILRQGSNQQFNREGVLNFLSFDEYVFDLKPFMTVDTTVRYRLSDRYLHELFYPDMRAQWERENRVKMLAEGHSRIASSLYNLTNMALALAAIVGATFSRFGYGGRIATAAGIAVLVRVLGFVVQAAASSNEMLNVGQYLVPLGALAWAFFTLLRDRLPAPKRGFSAARLALSGA